MGSNSCRVTGCSLQLKNNVTEADIRKALADFLEFADTNFEAEVGDNIEFDEGELHFSVDYWGTSASSDAIDDLIESLSAIVLGGQWIMLFDFDTGAIDEMKEPRFIGTDEERYQGRLHYGISMMESWVAPLIGEQAFKSVAAYIKAQPVIEIGS